MPDQLPHQPQSMSESQLDESPTMSENVSSPTKESVLKPLDLSKGSTMIKPPKLALAIMVAALVAGLGTGYGLNQLQAGSGSSKLGGSKNLKQVPTSTISAGDVFGSPDESTFKDSAEGYLEAGGINGEGSHKLIRPGGESQTVYLTSSITDLDEFVGMEVKVWGETFKGQQAGWLMDVGRIKVKKVEGKVPTQD